MEPDPSEGPCTKQFVRVLAREMFRGTITDDAAKLEAIAELASHTFWKSMDGRLMAYHLENRVSPAITRVTAGDFLAGFAHAICLNEHLADILEPGQKPPSSDPWAPPTS